MAPGVYKTCVAEVVCSTLTWRDHRIRFSGFSRYKGDATQSASVSLSLGQYPPLLLVGFPAHVLLLALHPVLAQRWVIGRVLPCDRGEASDWGYVGFDQVCLSFIEGPIAVVPEVARLHPCTSFVRVAAFRPPPEHLPLGMADFLKDMLGRTVPVVVCPSPDNRVECLPDPPCRGLLRCVQVRSDGPPVLEDFFLLWDGQQCALFPALPDVKPPAVQPCLAVHDPGFGCTACQASFLQQLLYPGSRIGCQYCPCWGRAHTVICIAQDRCAAVAACASGWGLGPSIGLCCVEQPFHPIPCHMRQPWGEDSSLWRARGGGRAGTHFDNSCLQPLPQWGGEDGQLGQPGAMVNIVKGSNNFIPLSTTHR